MHRFPCRIHGAHGVLVMNHVVVEAKHEVEAQQQRYNVPFVGVINANLLGLVGIEWRQSM